MKLTESQQRAVEEKGQNILVSAAAGSGKTAVLVQRIIQALLRDEDPVDIDRILVMTFTKAAAGEMRERIMNAINERLKTGGNSRLYRQAALVHNAHISTIHGFCLDVIRNHFHRIDLSPDFRTMDEPEGKLMMQDVLEEVLEEAYEAADPAFLAMSERISAGKNDRKLADAILKLYGFAVSSPDAEKWFETCRKLYSKIDEDGFDAHPLAREQTAYYKGTLMSIGELARKMLKITEEADGPYMYREAVESDLETIRRLLEAETYQNFADILRNYAPVTLGRADKNGPEVNDEKKELVKTLRTKVKSALTDMRKADFSLSVEQIVSRMKDCEQDVDILLQLTETFYERFQEKKRKKGLIDFNDMEQYCLKILTGYPSIAEEYREYFREIYVDEYQDSNYVQEAIVNAIADNNVFNVGDVKQSIYSFRMARPDLFLKKYEDYKENRGGIRIDLQENFRSRLEVIRAVNEVFEKIMQENPCRMKYDDEAALKYGAAYYDNTPVIEKDGPEERSRQKETQCVREADVTTAGYENVTEENASTTCVDSAGHIPYIAEYVGILKEEGVDRIELEARYIAGRIRELIESRLQVFDKELNGFRPVRYSDIVILLRVTKGADEKFCSVIGGSGIPIHASSTTGYFSANEIVWLLSFLQVIDNPLQDIPLASALLSPIGGFTNEELAIIRSRDRKTTLYQSLKEFCENSTDQVNTPVIEKCRVFLLELQSFREKTAYTSVYEILREIVDGDYGRRILSMTGGQKRYANLNMLLNHALEFEKTNYRGLFQFIRYVEFLKKNEIDYGEANLLSERDDTVRLMSIHKSKGLEFPVVFLAMMHKGMNFQDARASLVLDSDLGIGVFDVDLEKRTRMQTIARSVIGKKIQRDCLAEEIRIFYVAMTRAREKLIMTGIAEDENAVLGNCFSTLRASSMRDLLASALGEDGFFSNIRVSSASVTGLLMDGMKREISMEEAQLALKERLRSKKEIVPDPMLEERLRFVYPADPNDHYGKISVTELKKRSMQIASAEEYEDGEKLPGHETEDTELIPAFMGENAPVISAAGHGTAFHRILEIWDYSLAPKPESVRAFLEQAAKNRRVEEDYLKAVREEEILDFLKTDLARRMQEAFNRKELYREQPFVIRDENELLVQGIIDAYFIENGKIVLVDYKTDRVSSGKVLTERYRVQLDYYEKALARLSGLPVKEKIIYSSVLKKTVLL